MKNIFYCIDCDNEFESPSWDGNNAVCPSCSSTRWYDIEEEREERQMKHKRIFASDEN